MHRLKSFKYLYNSTLRNCMINDTFISSQDLTVRRYFCSHCQNNSKGHFKLVSDSNFHLRQHSTHAELIPKLSRKKKKIKFRKYVELLEVDNNVMTQTKAAVSNLKPFHLSKLVQNPEMTLGQLHRLKVVNNKNITSKLRHNLNEVNPRVDLEVQREIENSLLEKYKDIDRLSNHNEDDCALIFASENFSDLLFFHNRDKIKVIKDSYDKFMKETVRDQKMRDLVLAINEGVNQNMSHNKINYKNESTNESFPIENCDDFDNTEGIHKLFRDFLSESRRKQNLADFEYEEDIIDLEEKECLLPSKLNLSEEHEYLESNYLKPQHVDDKCNIDVKVNPQFSKTSTTNSKSSQKQKLKKAKSKKHSKELAAQVRIDELQKFAKEESLTRLLSAHLEMCLASGLLDKGYQILMHYRSRGKKSTNHALVKNIKLYNILLHGFAAKGDYNKVTDIVNKMKQDQLIFNAQSFAAIFECIENSQIVDKYTILREHFGNMKLKELELNDLIVKCKFTSSQRKSVLSAIKRLEPTFTPVYSSTDLNYQCSLLDNLNERHNNKESPNIQYSPVNGLLTVDDLKKKVSEQVHSELRGTISIKNIQTSNEVSDSVLYCREKLKEYDEDWRKTMKESFVRNFSILKAQSDASHSALNICPYLKVLKVDEFVDLVMLELHKLAQGSETYSPSLRFLQRELGLNVYLRYQIQVKTQNGVIDKLIKLYDEYNEWYLHRNEHDKVQRINSRQKWQQLLYQNQQGASLDLEENIWPNTICAGIGKFLYNILINDVKINVKIFKKNSKKSKPMPAFYIVYRSLGQTTRQELKPHPMLARLLHDSEPSTLSMDARLMPSLCPPLPWVSPNSGGYLVARTSIMRMTINAVHQKQRLNEATVQSLYPAMDSLNQLGDVPWKINSSIFNILLHVFRSGGSRELNIPCPASSLRLPMDTLEAMTRKERAALMRRRAAVTRQRQEMHSLWCDSLYKFSLANHYRDKIFWLPHNMDFRGRAYPCSPHLTHLGGDVARSLLVFAKGEPLGADGLSWLKLHCINLTGTMKRSTIKERLEFVETVMDDILDSADNPLEGRRWWIKSDSQWQTLACCMEIANAIRSPNHEEYICHFPIHQDGSCNGLQHYAALGGDEAGAYSVNLSAADRPQDVYSTIVALVEAGRAQDAAKGNKIALALEGFVKRKVIKQTVMTTVYGVTRFGARLQIAKQLKDIDKFPKEHVWMASHYLTQKTFESLQQMFTSTKEIQDWFTECAKLIAGICKDKVEWVTPLGLPVVQPYHVNMKWNNDCRTNIVEYAHVDIFEKPCIVKQKNAFPPNFIHSLDSSHMMLTSIYSELNNITFVSVHDCFWTHPSSAHIMNKICREQFFALHSEPILQNLSDYFVKRYSIPTNEFTNTGSILDSSKKKLNHILKKLPQKGKFNLKNVLSSVYFFS